MAGLPAPHPAHHSKWELGILLGAQKSELMVPNFGVLSVPQGPSSGLDTQKTSRKEVCGRNIEQWGELPGTVTVSDGPAILAEQWKA